MPVFGDKSAAKLNADPADYEKIHYAFFGSKHPGLVAPNSIDVVLTFRNLHDGVNQSDADIVLASIHRALKRGGTLGVEDHPGNPRLPQDPKGAIRYLREDYAIQSIEKARFKLVGKLEINANPRDTAGLSSRCLDIAARSRSWRSGPRKVPGGRRSR